MKTKQQKEYAEELAFKRWPKSNNGFDESTYVATRLFFIEGYLSAIKENSMEDLFDRLYQTTERVKEIVQMFEDQNNELSVPLIINPLKKVIELNEGVIKTALL